MPKNKHHTTRDPPLNRNRKREEEQSPTSITTTKFKPIYTQPLHNHQERVGKREKEMAIAKPMPKPKSKPKQITTPTPTTKPTITTTTLIHHHHNQSTQCQKRKTQPIMLIQPKREKTKPQIKFNTTNPNWHSAKKENPNQCYLAKERQKTKDLTEKQREHSCPLEREIVIMDFDFGTKENGKVERERELSVGSQILGLLQKLRYVHFC